MMPASVRYEFTEVTGAHDFWKGFWRLADPKISLASMASIFLGTCVAAADGSLNIAWLAITIIGIFAIEVAKNASGEIVDYDSGDDLSVTPEDRSPFSGGKRVLVNGLTRKQTAAISAISYFLGTLAGLSIVFGREPKVFWIGVIGIACAYFYHARPLRLSYRGLGEVAVAICYGPLIATGTFLVQRGHVSFHILSLSVPLGLLIAAFLWINEFPDYAADKASGKRTLVVICGQGPGSYIFLLIQVIAFSILALLPLFGAPKGTWFGFIALLSAIPSAITLRKNPEITRLIIPAQRNALLTFVLFSIGTGLGQL